MLSDEEIHGIFYPMGTASEAQLQVARACTRAIESAACAERDARIAELEAANEAFGKRQEWWNARMLELEHQLAEARKDAKTFTEEQIDAAVKAWFAEKIISGRYPFSKRMRAAIAAAIKEQT